jgi:valyl-tRNA synthetase
MASAGRTLTLPLVNREIPLVCDQHADPLLGSGCVKITPAHDHNDYEVALRCKLPMRNMMNANGTINAEGKQYEGLTMPEGRKRVVADLEAQGLIENIEAKETEIGHSERSKTAIEPFLSDQWFLKMGELAQSAIDTVVDGRVKFFPERYAKTYIDWLAEKRDWCISRQLWWGHRIPVWTATLDTGGVVDAEYDSRNEKVKSQAWNGFLSYFDACGIRADEVILDKPHDWEIRVCPGSDRALAALSALRDYFKSYGWKRLTPDSKATAPLSRVPGFEMATIAADQIFTSIIALEQDQDVLDTWFSSALWPYSTLGWPDKTADLDYYYPGSVLVTSRDIITNWVARMVLTGLYNMGEIPFPHVYIHTKILDGRGETMSKSKGNGVDPIDVVEVYGADALRYTMADMATETQDVRMPVDYVCPHCAHLTPQATVVPRGKQPADMHKVKCAGCKKEFATQWAPQALRDELGTAKESSEKFEIGRNFCNKLWNSARFAFMNLEGTPCAKLDLAKLPPEDRWILARLSTTVRELHTELSQYHYSPALKLVRDFFWDSFCDWYIELTKPRLRDPATAGPAQQVLAFVLDQVLRLLSPFLPFITERLWGELNRLAPQRGLPGIAEAPAPDLLMLAPFPPEKGYPGLDDAHVLEMFEDLQNAVRGIRDLRNKCGVPNRQMVDVTIKAATNHLDMIRAQTHVVAEMAEVGKLNLVTQVQRPRNAGTTVVGPLQIFVHDVSDDAAERKRLEKELESVTKRRSGAEGKLSNAQFIANAKPEVVEAERERLEELKKSEKAIRESLADLGG